MTAHDPDQEEHIERVSDVLETIILDFHATSPRQFHNADLLAFVSSRIGIPVAPDSPGRILRSLRQQRKLNYKIINRRASLYEFIPVPPAVPKSDLFEGWEDVGN